MLEKVLSRIGVADKLGSIVHESCGSPWTSASASMKHVWKARTEYCGAGWCSRTLARARASVAQGVSLPGDVRPVMPGGWWPSNSCCASCGDPLMSRTCTTCASWWGRSARSWGIITPSPATSRPSPASAMTVSGSRPVSPAWRNGSRSFSSAPRPCLSRRSDLPPRSGSQRRPGASLR